MDALRRALPLAFLGLLGPSLAGAQTVSSLTDATLPLTDQEYLYIVQNGQPRRVHPSAVADTLTVPTADILGGASNEFTTITIGSGLSLSGGVLTAVSGGGGINQLTGDVTAGPGTGSQVATLATVNADVGSFTNASITVNAKGLITAASSGSSACAGIAATAVLFSDGASCAGDVTHFYYVQTDSVTYASHLTLDNTGVQVATLNGAIVADLIGGNASRGGALRVRQTAAGGSIRIGYGDANGQAYISAYDSVEAVDHLALNYGGGPVSIGTDLPQFVGQTEPGAALFSLAGASQWHFTIGSSGAMQGGIFNNASALPELRFGAGLRLSSDAASTSMVPNRFTAAGLRDSTVISCGTLTTDGDGDLTCAATPPPQRLAIGWDPALDPAANVIATIDQASTLVSLVGTVVTPVGAAATLSVHKAGSGVACAAGTVLHSGSLDANGAANTNQTLTVTVTALAAGDRLCLVTSDSANWIAGVGMGGITARITTP